jgi:hypothetical protein
VSKRTKFLLGIGVIAALVIGWQVAAFAVHDTGAFELDGNAVNGSAPGDDWDNVCHQVTKTLPAADQQCKTAADTTGASAVSWVAEPNLNSTIFTGGGSKDPQNINKWAWKDGAGGLPDKDNLLHSFAARYPSTSDGDVLFFGSDRYDNSGDAQQGFWFFQNKITLNGTSSGSFNGLHKNGDLLVVSDFSNGGTTSTITVYKWDTRCTKTGVQVDDDNNPTTPSLTCGDANLLILATSNSANCANPNPDTACGIVNPAENPLTKAPWTFLDKSGNTNYLNGEFFEGGVNLSELGLGNECFSSVASETRSSTSTTAVLKDFVLGQLANCQADMTTQASRSGTITPGTEVTDTATISVSGGTNATDPTGNVTFTLCAEAQLTANGCETGGTQVGNPVALVGGTPNDGTATATSDAVNTATSPLTPGKYCFRADWPGDTNYPGARSHTNSSTTPPNNECFTVQDTSSITTAQSWVPNDSAHVTLGSGGAPDGTVTFELFESADCTGTAVALDGLADRPIDNNGDAVTANTAAVPADLGGTDGTISWLATFNPADGSGLPEATAHCETSTVTIDDDITSP